MIPLRRFITLIQVYSDCTWCLIHYKTLDNYVYFEVLGTTDVSYLQSGVCSDFGDFSPLEELLGCENSDSILWTLRTICDADQRDHT